MKIFDRAKDKNVAAVVIESASEGYVYAGTEDAVAEDDYLDLFVHGVLLKTVADEAESYQRAIGFTDGDFVWAALGE